MTEIQLTLKEQLINYLNLECDFYDICGFDIYDINIEQNDKIMQLFKKDEFNKDYFDNHQLYIFYAMYIVTKIKYVNKLQCQILYDTLNHVIIMHNYKLCYYLMNNNIYNFDCHKIEYNK